MGVWVVTLKTVKLNTGLSLRKKLLTADSMQKYANLITFREQHELLRCQSRL